MKKTLVLAAVAALFACSAQAHDMPSQPPVSAEPLVQSLVFKGDDADWKVSKPVHFTGQLHAHCQAGMLHCSFPIFAPVPLGASCNCNGWPGGVVAVHY